MHDQMAINLPFATLNNRRQYKLKAGWPIVGHILNIVTRILSISWLFCSAHCKEATFILIFIDALNE